MKRAGAEVQIIVARPAESTTPDPTLALRRLGPDARVEILHSAAACRARCRDGSVDLIVAEAALGCRMLEAARRIRTGGAPGDRREPRRK